MNEWQIMLTAVLAVFGVAGIGAAARRANWLNEQADQTLLRLVIRVLVPALIVHTILGDDRLRAYENLAWPPLIGFSTIVGGFAVAAAVAWVFRGPLGLDSPAKRRTFALCIGVYNYGYVPIPLIDTLFAPGAVDAAPSQGGALGVLFVHNLGIEVAMWTVGVMLVSGRFDRHWWRNLINAPILAIVGALTMNFLGLHHVVPDFARTMLGMLAVCAVPMSLLLIGATIADHIKDARLLGGGPVILSSSALRLGLLPLGFLVLAWLTPISTELKQVVVIQAAMPAAVFPIMLARLYGGDVPTAMRVVLGTSLLSLITMPFWLWGGMQFLGLSMGGE